MRNIRHSVGRNAVNNRQDVIIVQSLLKRHGASYIDVDGICGPLTKKAIIEFQSKFYTHPDGVITPGKKTSIYLNNFTGLLTQDSSTSLAINHAERKLSSIQPWQKEGEKQKGSASEATKNAVYPQIITIGMLDAVNPSGKGKIGVNATALPYLNRNANHFNMTDKREIAYFLSQISAESGLQPIAENLNYRVSAMRDKFGYQALRMCKKKLCKKIRVRRDKLWTQTSHYAHHPQALGNYVYADRMGNGDEASGDGYRYRGRGFLQITGKNLYRRMQDYHHQEFPDDINNLLNNPDLVADRNHYEYAVETAFVYWFDIANVHDLAISADATVKAVTRKVNGGQNGYQARLNAFNRLADYLGLTKASQ